MIKGSIIFIFLWVFCVSHSQEDISYFLDQEFEVDDQVPAPEEVIGFRIGDWHVSHDKLVEYAGKLAEKSQRVVLKTYGHTYEGRPLIHLIFSSPENITKLDQLKEAHLDYMNPRNATEVSKENIPLVVLLGYSVHGNESSAGNASLLVAYYLAASRETKVKELLKNHIVIIDPCLNPDGFQRHSGWINMHKSANLVTDPNARGFHEAWPGGRTNHYWFDLNRDWILLQQPESRGRVQQFHEWKPNIVTDHHEMDAESTFFFQPGVPSRNNPLTPEKNYTLTKKIAGYHEKVLNSVGTLYFSEEVFDDFYYGKGSTYPDVNGSVGILFEQAGLRGHARETEEGIKTFKQSIRNQVLVSLSTLDAAYNMKNELLDYQKHFYHESFALAAIDPVKAYVFTDADTEKLNHFMKVLKGHHIKVYGLSRDIEVQNKKFMSGSSYLIPLKQEQYRLIRSFFQSDVIYEDSSFYDISTWTLPLAFNLKYAPIQKDVQLQSAIGEELDMIKRAEGKVSGDGDYAYLIEWNTHSAPGVLYRLLHNNVRVKVAGKPFYYEDGSISKQFDYGTLLIPSGIQDFPKAELEHMMQGLAIEKGITVYGLSTGITKKGIDLGSGQFASLHEPRIALITGEGVSSYEAGEIWHLFDQHYQVPISLLDQKDLYPGVLESYNTLILVSGDYQHISIEQADELKAWVKRGGTIVAFKNANKWLNDNGFVTINFVEEVKPDTTLSFRYADKTKNQNIHRISGAIFQTEIDYTHPLGYGYHNRALPVFKSGTLSFHIASDPYDNVGIFTENPLISGYCSQKNLDRIKNSSFIQTHALGKGMIVSISDDLNFRAFWYGTQRIIANAVFFTPVINHQK